MAIESTSTDSESLNQHAEQNSSGQADTSSALSNESEIEASGTSEDQSNEGDQVESKESQDEASKNRNKNGFKKRIDRLNRNISERDTHIKSLQQELEKFKQSSQLEKDANKLADGEPNPDDFSTNAEYIRALNKFERDQEKAAAKKEAEQATISSENKKIIDGHSSRIEEFKKSTPDFDAVVGEFAEVYGDFQASESVLKTLMSSEHGAQILYDVLKDHDEYDRLAAMTDDQIIREIYKKEARIEVSKDSTKNTPLKTSKAPAPVSPIAKGTVAVAKSISDPGISFAEYEKLRRKQQKKY